MSASILQLLNEHPCNNKQMDSFLIRSFMSFATKRQKLIVQLFIFVNLNNVYGRLCVRGGTLK